MQIDRLSRCVPGLAAVVVAALALSLAGCNKQPATTAPQPDHAAPVPSSPQSQPPSATSEPNPAATAQDSDSDSDEAGEGPEIPGTVEGKPALMSEDAFLSAYRQIDGEVVLNDGLMYRVMVSGKGKSPKAADSVRVTYKGSLMDGSVFDQTKPGETLTLKLAQTIKGWQEALPLMKEGDKWEVVIPSALAYGEAGRPGIPPNSPLVFEIALVEVIKS